MSLLAFILVLTTSCHKDIHPPAGITSTDEQASLVTTRGRSLTATGSILHEEWDNVNGYDVSDIPPNSAPTSNATVADNQVNFWNANNYNNNAWLAPGTDKPQGWDGNSWGAGIDASILPAIFLTLH